MPLVVTMFFVVLCFNRTPDAVAAACSMTTTGIPPVSRLTTTAIDQAKVLLESARDEQLRL